MTDSQSDHQSSTSTPTISRDEPLLRVTNLAVDATTRQRTVRLLSDVSLEAVAGTTLGVVGESGSGKSLTALSVMGLLPSGLTVEAGTIGFQNQNLVGMSRQAFRNIRGSHVGMIFQDPQNSLNPAYTIGNQLIETIRAHDKTLDKGAARDRAVELLERVGIPSAASRLGDYPHQFSGGMAQRVMIALAISCKPSLLIADEPTTALDVTVQAQILSLLRSLQAEMSMTLVLISHDLSVIAQMADDVAVMYAGEVVEYGKTGQVLRDPQHPYTAALLSAQPEARDDSGRLSVIRGTVPDAGTMITGCKFRDRCDHATDRCAAEHPELLTSNGSSVRCLRSDEITLTRYGASSVPFEKRSKVTSDAPLVSIEAVSKSFRLGGRLLRSSGSEFFAVRDADLKVWPGETLGVVGESGAGKSTLGRIVLGLEQPTSGRVTFDGIDVHAASRRDRRTLHRDMSVVFQNPYASLDPSMSIAESVVEPLTVEQPLGRGERFARAEALLSEVGLSSAYLQRRPHELSGGQRQRVAIARALSLRPRLVVCDEAVSALDVSTQAQVLNLLSDLQAEHNTAYLFVGHDLAVVHHISDRIAVMYQGQVVEVGPSDDIYHRPQHPYTQALLSAVLSVDVDADQIKPQVAPADQPPPTTGCAFAHRCPHVTAVCREVEPRLEPHAQSEVACHLVNNTVAH